MAITREEVLHVAKLARLELTDDEVERLTGELSAILEAVSKVSELDLADVPPTSHPLELVNGWGEDVPHESLPLDQAFANAPAREGDSSRCRRPYERGIDTLRLTAEEALGLLERKEVSAAELHRAYLDAVAERDPELHCYLRTVDEPAGEGVPIALKDVISTAGRRDDGRVEDPRGLRARLRRDGGRALQGRRAAAAREDEHGRVRDGLVDRELGLRALAQSLGSHARPRRLGRRHRCRGLGRPRALGARLRHRRLDQAALGAVRERRPAADLRDGQPLRRRRVRVEPRPGRPGREERPRLRAPLLDHRRPRSGRLDDRRRARGRAAARARA